MTGRFTGTRYSLHNGENEYKSELRLDTILNTIINPFQYNQVIRQRYETFCDVISFPYPRERILFTVQSCNKILCFSKGEPYNQMRYITNEDKRHLLSIRKYQVKTKKNILII